MKRRGYAAMGLGLVGALTLAVWAAEEEEEQKVSIDQIPAKAREAIMKEAGPNKIAGATKEKEFGGMAYNGTWDADGKWHEVSVNGDGAVLARAEHVDAGEVPAAVLKTAAKEFPGAKELTYERRMLVTYEVAGTVKGKEKEVVIYPNGKKGK